LEDRGKQSVLTLYNNPAGADCWGILVVAQRLLTAAQPERYAANQLRRSSSSKLITKLIIQVCTADNLLDLLKAHKSGSWVVAQGKEQEITDVEIVSFDGTQKIEGTFNAASSFRLNDGRLVIAFTNACIRNCSISFDGRNPVQYF
jgi:hypothetical protein